MGIPDHLTFLLSNVYAGQEATVRTGHGTIDWFKIWKGVNQGCISSPCLFNLYKELLLLSHFSCVRLCATPQTAAHQAPPSLGLSRQEHWSGLPFPSPMYESEKSKWSRSVLSDPQRPHGVQPSRLLHPWDFPGKSTGVGCHCLHIMQNDRLDESQAGIKISGRNINNLPPICRWYHLNGRKEKGTKKLLDEGERGEWESWLKTQHSKQ